MLIKCECESAAKRLGAASETRCPNTLCRAISEKLNFSTDSLSHPVCFVGTPPVCQVWRATSAFKTTLRAKLGVYNQSQWGSWLKVGNIVVGLYCLYELRWEMYVLTDGNGWAKRSEVWPLTSACITYSACDYFNCKMGKSIVVFTHKLKIKIKIPNSRETVHLTKIKMFMVEQVSGTEHPDWWLSFLSGWDFNLFFFIERYT